MPRNIKKGTAKENNFKGKKSRLLKKWELK